MTEKHWHNLFEDTKRFKRIRKIKELPTFGKFVAEMLIFAAANAFFSIEFGIYRRQSNRFLFSSPSKARVKSFLSPGLPFLITYTSDSNWYALISVS